MCIEKQQLESRQQIKIKAHKMSNLSFFLIFFFLKLLSHISKLNINLLLKD